MKNNRLRGWEKLKDPYWAEKARIELTHGLVKEVAESEPEIGQLQTIHTPFELCNEIVDKLSQSCDIHQASIAVLFNLEFITCLIERGVKPGRITFFGDSELKRKRAREWYNVKSHSISYNGSKKNGERIEIMPKIKKQFDCVIMNPPYQPPTKANAKNGGSGSRNTIWDKFVEMSLNLIFPNGYACHVHPVIWRKPDSEMWGIAKHQLLHLSMHNESDGIKTFGASTPFDWYVLKNTPYNDKTTVIDTDRKIHKIDLSSLSFLPNCDLEVVFGLLAKPGEEKCEVLFSYTEYETRKPWMSEKKTGKFRHPCVHATSKDKIRYWYSSRKGEFFGTSKVIFGEARRPWQVVIDMDGELGITQQSIALKVKNKKEAVNLKKALESDAFYDFLSSVRWSGFRIDWRMFKYFRRDFWKEFI